MGGGRRKAKEKGKEGGGGATSAAGAGGATASQLPRKICGPSLVETIRGRLLGREVAIVCAGESHEEAIDLTRSKCIIEPVEGWLPFEIPGGGFFDPEDASATQEGLSLERAKSWAAEIIESFDDESSSSSSGEEEEDSDGDDDALETAGGYLVYVPGPVRRGGKERGTATVFPPDARRGPEFPAPPEGAIVLEWGDEDQEAREFNTRRLSGERVPPEEHDALIDRRKKRLVAEEGIVLLDDWLLHQASHEGVHVSVLLETTVHPEELELHIDDSFGPAPLAHECLRRVELDSDADSDDEADPDDGSGCYLDYFYRKVSAKLPRERFRGVDPRDIGDPSDDALRHVAVALGDQHPPAPPDAEAEELERLGAEPAAEDDSDDEGGGSASRWKELRVERLPAVPSWEGFFSAAAELLYYSPQVKGDYTPFLSRVVGSPAKLKQFFRALYFGTVPEAVAVLSLEAEHRSMAQVRSLAYRPEGKGQQPLFKRPAVRSKIPVRAAPLERYLKARGSDPPRTWTSALADRLRSAGCAELVSAAERWLADSVGYLLSDPKEADELGDYFAAWLRACHRKIWDDIDRSDPEELRRRDWMPSLSRPKSKKHRHNLRDITIPGLEEAFRELRAFDPKASSTKRQRVLAKILIDAFQLRLVDLAMVLAVADAVRSAAGEDGEGGEAVPVVVVLYAGEDHSRSVVDFYKSRGFSASGLSGGGRVGKSDWEDDEPRALAFPPYLQDVRNLFPLPK